MGKNTQNYTENDTINKKAKIIYIHNINNFDYTFPLVRYDTLDDIIHASKKNIQTGRDYISLYASSFI